MTETKGGSESERARPAVIAATAAIGLAGWAFLALATYWPDLAPPALARPDPLAFVVFLVVIIAARAMATRLLPGSPVALDSAFYVAAAVSLGSVTAGRLVALALTVDVIWRLIHADERAPAGRGRRWAESLAFLVYFGGMSGALLTLCGWLFGVDAVLSGAEAGELSVLGVVLATGAVFLVAHYAIQGMRLWSLGQPLRVYLTRLAVPALLAEAALLPLAAITVFLYDPDRPLKFSLLGSIFLLVNYAFHRLSRTGGALRQRVSELEILNIMAHRLASSLQTRELVETVARETLAAFPEATALSLFHEPDGKGGRVVDRFARSAPGERRSADDVGPSARLVEQVMRENRTLLLGDLDASHGGARSWLGVPVEIHGAVEGALAVESPAPHAFAPDRVRLLEAIAAQAAVALQNARLYDMAMVDGLTGLFVRRYFDARLDEEIQRSRRFGTDFSIVLMDIDDFKALNDTYGHTVGDRLLRAIAEAVRGQMRAADTAARYGGEEVSMILPRTTVVEAYAVAERVRRQIAALRFEEAGEILTVTASFGVASHPDGGAEEAVGLIRLADRALYRAKRTGKNRVELYWRDEADARRSSLRPV